MIADQWKCGNEFLPYHPSASQCSPDYRDGWNHCYSAAQSALQAKDAEIAALKEDAERYRWLRDPKRCEALGKEPYVGIEDDDEHPNHWALIGEKADAAIDSALAAGDGEGKSE